MVKLPLLKSEIRSPKTASLPSVVLIGHVSPRAETVMVHTILSRCIQKLCRALPRLKVITVISCSNILRSSGIYQVTAIHRNSRFAINCFWNWHAWIFCVILHRLQSALALTDWSWRHGRWECAAVGTGVEGVCIAFLSITVSIFVVKGEGRFRFEYDESVW